MTTLNYGVCVYLFRFTYDEIERITTALGLDHVCHFSSIQVRKNLGFAMLVNRYRVERLLIDKIKWGLQFNANQFRPENLERFVSAIYEKGAKLPNVVGFIDGTVRERENPSLDYELKESYYNGWKHFPRLDYQSIVTPDGITSSVLGRKVGSGYSQYLHLMAKLEERIETYLKFSSDTDGSFALFGISSYLISQCLHRPFTYEHLSELDKIFNKSLERVQRAMKWEAGEMKK
ncbi:hypothetical protein PHYBLDRAFT_145713 [Phycomyces blakesleeanus NRRL 1555(-)]|uniref:DDE Tnp4 domain-containing protein n=1 Tax=Phycomyces blakesleeanus (strain ATCC 8743b / DSM 1359 / FGSC 10004 / NBRC 33097 / NRRL 1555) TaxID=763407 RepID=A0A167MMU7_PHYB8|nr:hypothetical protein PHYBLDRAFT_145713 [Phycomyces blakesleeanus NRRL 1555(-)]OAD73314.1 hypothetical protein PHYBLDRAFT_145713 [Phycomyces blakesleeanus NRRL 1555(-)]|eukprot:XP_018291354.1 hypothetical protein PHYBLDRAFT_145713 [Phycomyces blakesleeanus NRRL 1555(-)]